MSSPRNRLWLLPVLLLASQAWALGLGDIRLDSALNEPLRAEIELLTATPEELNNLTIQMASAETFARYDLDRPLFLTRIEFNIVRSGRADGNIIRVRSREPITEPFLTFLVEASWSRGRLLREYTVLLDPPTFAPPPVQAQTETVTAPTRAAPADSGQIQRQSPPPVRQTPPPSPAIQAPVEPAPSTERPAPAPTPTPVAQDSPDSASFDTRPSGDVVVRRGDTLWGIASRMRPDSRLTMNQTMLAIYEANPQAFANNINVLRAGASLRIPSADEIFRISRGDALAEVQRQNASWSGGIAPGLPAADPQPSLTLVPPDDEDELPAVDTSVAPSVDDSIVDDDVIVDPVEQRIAEIEATLDNPQALLSIESNELDALRRELAELRGEELPAVDDATDEILDDDVFVDADADATAADDEVAVDDDGVMADSGTTDDVIEPVQDTPAVPTVARPAEPEGGIVDTILGYLGNIWVIIGSALALAVLVLVWFMRRSPGGGDEDITGVWDALDADDMEADAESISSTERLRAMAQDDDTSIVVVEQDRSADPTSSMEAIDPLQDLEPGEGLRTVETPAMPAPDATAEIPAVTPDAQPEAGASLEDTFSSETAINLDQSDPVAEADFHMAYGLYDQAADLINGALESDPGRQDLLAKLCEIYFVWGNRDAFIDAAGRTKAAIGAEGGADWDKIVIMGQQIAADHALFSGVSAEGATKAMDLSFDEGGGDAGALDIDFAGGPDGAVSDVIDLGADNDDVGDETGQVLISPGAGGDIDFSFDEDVDLEASATREMPGPGAETDDEPTAEIAAVDEATSEMPAADDATSEIPAADATTEAPTIEQQFENFEATGEMPTISDTPAAPATDATAEIDLDDLGLDLDGLEDAVGADDFADLEDTAESQTLQMDDDLEATGKNPAITDVDSLAATGKNLEVDLDIGDDTDVGIDSNLLDATGQTQILTEDMAVETGRHRVDEIGGDDRTEMASLDDTIGADEPTTALSDDAETLLASLDDDDDEFDFAKTEALPEDAFSGDMSGDATGEMPGLAGSTDLDLDLDDLTAALKVSEIGDTVSQPRDDATVEQPRLRPGQGADSAATQSLAPEDISGDLHEARTMTEVGTKLDLARAYVDMGDPGGARSILEEVLDEGDDAQKQQAQQLLDSLPS